MSKRMGGGLILLLVVVFVLAACGRAEPTPTPTPEPPTPTPEPPTPTPVPPTPVPPSPTPEPPAEAAPPAALVEEGQMLAQQLGCLGCHSVDGTTLVGPTWKGLFGRERVFQDGTTAVADEEYLRRSIVDPSAQVVQGFPDNVMPQNYGDRLSEEQLEALVAYIKSLQ